MGGLTSAPKAAGVSDCVISRIGTRMSGREPSTYTFDELGNGLTAASSTCAVAFRNFGFAFIDCAPREFRRRALKVGTHPSRFPTPALPVSGSEGLSHPATGCARTPA